MIFFGFAVLLVRLYLFPTFVFSSFFAPLSYNVKFGASFPGSKDGLVKVWNFNNGSCLDEYETCEENEIGGLVYTRNRLFTGTKFHSFILPPPPPPPPLSEHKFYGRNRIDLYYIYSIHVK